MVDTMIVIGKETIDMNAPCDVAAALRKVELRLAAGLVRETVRFGEDEVTFMSASDRKLTALIDRYEAQCSRLTPGARPRRHARRIRFV